ncbi:MAG: hypothetical protein QE510_01150 [Verrucomicrobiota bacterium]|nr:hypothetical protein [Verrucomicrobiota bacterium]
MKLQSQILQDHYRRWWWAHLVAFLGFGAIGVAVGFGLDPHKIPLGAGAFLGAVALAVGLNARTNARTLLSLPIRASELGTTLWWIAVPLSALAPAAGLAVGWTVSDLFGSTVPVGVAALLRFLLLTQSVSTFQFTVLCFMPNAYPSDLREKILGWVTGAFWGIGLSASCSFTLFWSESRTVWDPLSCVILAVGATCGLVSWRRRTAFLLKRARKNEGPTQSVRSTVVLPKPSGLDGFAGLYLSMFSVGSALGLVVSGAFWAYMALSPDRMAAIRPHVIPMRALAGGATVVTKFTGDLGRVQVVLIWLMIVFPFLFVWPSLASLRHWRTLPISAQSMAWVLIGLHLTGSFGCILPMHALMKWLINQSSLLASQPVGWSDLGLLVLEAGLFAMVPAFGLRFGVKSFNPWWFVLLSPLVVVAQSMLSPILDQFFEQGGEQLATVASVLTGVILLFVAQAWMARTLRRQSRIFSPGFHQFGRLNTSA